MKNVCIIGLGLIGGSYARALTRAGYTVDALDIDPDAIAFAKREGFIRCGAAFDGELVGRAELVVFGLYPQAVVDWVREHQACLRPGALLTDVTGVKGAVVHPVQALLRKDVEFLGSHPMAGREARGVAGSRADLFEGANFIITPTQSNTPQAVDRLRQLARDLGCGRVSLLSPQAHDEMVGFVSQLTHAIAVSLMNCRDSGELKAYTGDSFRDLTRIAKINETLWSELFVLNRQALAQEIDQFMLELGRLRDAVEQGDADTLQEMFRSSTVRRLEFEKR